MTIAFRPIPNASAQMRFIPLVITPGLDGWRVAFSGGSTFEIVGEFPDVDEAKSVRKLAEDARRRLAR